MGCEELSLEEATASDVILLVIALDEVTDPFVLEITWATVASVFPQDGEASQAKAPAGPSAEAETSFGVT